MSGWSGHETLRSELEMTLSDYTRMALEVHWPDEMVSGESGEWTPHQVGAHMAEWSEFILASLRRVELDIDPLIGRRLDDPGRLVGVERRGNLPLEETTVLVRESWTSIFELVERWTEHQWERRYRHLHYGTDVAAEFLRRAVGHFQGHLAQLERLRQKLGDRPSRDLSV